MVKVAIMYDFDKTLCTKNMQEYSLLPLLNIEADIFWKEVSQLSQQDNMDSVLAYMYLLLKKAGENGKNLNRELFRQQGNNIEYYPGVKSYFSRINEFAKNMHIELQHYIISSGTKEIIEGCDIFPYFHRVFASEFHYNKQGVADWPAVAINYTGKTQFLFRINKNCLDIFDNTTINAYTTQRDIPFNRMIYIGDGFTDVPCMQLVKQNNGYSIAVHTAESQTHQKLLEDKRVNFVAEANYLSNSQLDSILKSILTKISAEERLQQYQII
ncbi:MAG: HAD family hydrolase [Erysipelotrichia bacterium]|nr:HAD family hydrolase [Erysipelotrichia bacterium]